MNTLTKEWLQNTITSIESARDEIPFGLDEDQNNMLTALKIALASLAAVSDERAAYELFMEKRFGESVDRRRAKNGDREYMAWDMALGWIIWCHRAAMLQGGQPVNQTYNLPQTHFEQVADLYEMQFEDGRTCTFHTDAQKAVQWLQACDGNRVQEYVKLERLQNALAGNYPVTPDGWISCSDRMPEKGQNVLISVNFDSSLVEPLICSARYTGSTFRRGDATIKPGNGIEQATHWMPLPEPPQEVK
ncbi:TPA: DUF551 domain-containing protein [Escherichia coli]|uniref:DUF551 domain-containing protein n=1 Tax=Escherichia coli TaxID=562 RepID=UPI002967B92E|nr:DUF551 domain-containing protein [Escherichia coli]HDK1064837.1 DUF551 domain-containing protein [Escherichia coli]HDK1460842.1 DUF551 domain-containing protein [Escherichia coli]